MMIINNSTAKEYKIAVIFTGVLLSVNWTFCSASTNNSDDLSREGSGLQIHLPREITVKDNQLSLGQISVIRGEETLAAKASQIELGTISVPGQKIILNRPTIISRLASSGIPVSKVKFTGAEKIRIEQLRKTIEGAEFIESAEVFLKNNPPSANVCKYTPVRTPEDLILPGESREIELSPQIITNSSKTHARVRVLVLEKNKVIETREVTFRLTFQSKKAVALTDIKAGDMISPENVKFEETISDYPEPADFKLPYGMIARRSLPAGTTLSLNMFGPAAPAVVVERNRNVIIRIEKPGFLITAIGKTMEEGSPGDYIRVRNIDSQRIILVKVNEDGSVEPVL
jgi:flagella basal body P-ring formation protein FlgA